MGDGVSVGDQDVSGDTFVKESPISCKKIKSVALPDYHQIPVPPFAMLADVES